MIEPLSHTSSLCPYCLRKIPARRIMEKEAVYLEKSCPEHGSLPRVLLWKNKPKTYLEWKRPGQETPGAAIPAQPTKRRP